MPLALSLQRMGRLYLAPFSGEFGSNAQVKVFEVGMMANVCVCPPLEFHCSVLLVITVEAYTSAGDSGGSSFL